MVRALTFGRIFSLLLIFQCLGCTSIFYYPRVQNVKFYEPAKLGLAYEEVEIEVNSKLAVHGWWFPAKGATAKGTVVFYHGNAENITTHFLTLSWLPAEGYNFIIWDYPGYGVSQGKPNQKSIIEASEKVLKWVNQNRDNKPLIIYGQSLGGNIALRSALDFKDKIPLKAVVIDASFISYRSLARHKASSSWLLWLFQPFIWLSMSDSYAPEDVGRLSPVPLLVIHGQKDVVISSKFGEQIYDLASEPKKIWKIPEGLHGDTFVNYDRIYRKKFLEYLDAI